ncbi:MAG: TetR/AcrR family transcriptional regulator [Actinobacteria bacterium]|nr:MAG: TetR/AcrR family transcriptional regulator [Actinomycetota bacterium]
MAAAKQTSAQPRRRADAQRNIERILDAALEALTDDLDASMTEIARRAGVVRATIYVHYPTRDELLDAVTARAFSEIGEAIAAADPQRGEPIDALRRVVAATWRKLGRYHALVAITTARDTSEEVHERHAGVLDQLLPLVRRGQHSGAFRADVPADWHLSMLIALIHAASAEVRAGRVDDHDAEAAVTATVIGALARPA